MIFGTKVYIIARLNPGNHLNPYQLLCKYFAVVANKASKLSSLNPPSKYCATR